MGEPMLAVEGLRVAYNGEQVVHDVDLAVQPRSRLGLVGETGSGKSTLAMSLLGMLPRGGEIVAGRISFDGRDLTQLTEPEWCGLRGREISVVFQDAGGALDPVKRIGSQIAEAIRIHTSGVGRDEMRRRVAGALEQVGLPPGRADAYPHELSGGMRQRVAIAAALVHRPRVVVADEPTSALDVTTQAQTLKLLDDLVAEVGATLVMVSHDLGVVARFCEMAAVMYAGRIVEVGRSADLFAQPSHPYTAGLLSSVEGLSEPGNSRLPTIRGSAVVGTRQVDGCPFEPRCANPKRNARCVTEAPPLVPVGSSAAACHYPLAGSLPDVA